jgi:hypothetical protein
VIGENPGLTAVLATDVFVQCDTSGLNQTISWTDPDVYEPTYEAPRYKLVSPGARHHFAFNYHTHEQEDLASGGVDGSTKHGRPQKR